MAVHGTYWKIGINIDERLVATEVFLFFFFISFKIHLFIPFKFIDLLIKNEIILFLKV